MRRGVEHLLCEGIADALGARAREHGKRDPFADHRDVALAEDRPRRLLEPAEVAVEEDGVVARARTILAGDEDELGLGFHASTP